MVIFYAIDTDSLKYCELLEIALQDYRQLPYAWSEGEYRGEVVTTFTVDANPNLVAEYVHEVNEQVAASK